MTLAILIMVAFLFGIQLAAFFGLRDTRVQSEAAKKIARELYELQKQDSK